MSTDTITTDTVTGETPWLLTQMVCGWGYMCCRCDRDLGSPVPEMVGRRAEATGFKWHCLACLTDTVRADTISAWERKVDARTTTQ